LHGFSKIWLRLVSQKKDIDQPGEFCRPPSRSMERRKKTESELKSNPQKENEKKKH